MFIPTFRFFSGSSPAARLSTDESAPEDSPQDVEPRAQSATQDNSPSSHTRDSDSPDVPSVDTPSPPQSPGTTSPSSASQGLRLFHWSGSPPSTEQSRTPAGPSGLVTLQHFQYKKESFSHRPPGDTSLPRHSSTDGNPEEKDDLPDSPPSQDSAYFSQSQPNLTSCHKEEVFTDSFPSSYHHTAASVRSYNSPLLLLMCIHSLWLGQPLHIHHHHSFMAQWVCRKLFR